MKFFQGIGFMVVVAGSAVVGEGLADGVWGGYCVYAVPAVMSLVAWILGWSTGRTK